MFLFFAISAVLISTTGYAQISFPDFTSVNGLNFIGSAIQSTNKLRLTVAEVDGQTGAVWDSTQQEIQTGFQTIFQFQLIPPANDNPADGFAFVIQNDSIDATATVAGQNIGFTGIPNCLAIKFDTYQNAGDPNNNFVSVQSRGTLPNDADVQYSLGYTTNIPHLVDGNIHTVKINYSPDTLLIFIDNLTVPVLVVDVKIDSLLKLNNSKAWVGFTASTGAETETAYILNWSFGEPVPKIAASIQQSFGNLTCDSSRFDTVYVHNIGNQVLSLSSAEFLQGNKGFTVESPVTYPDSIDPGDSMSFIIHFLPILNGALNDTLAIYSNDTLPSHNPWNIAFSGTYTPIGLQAPPLSFGFVTPTQFPVTKKLTVINFGTMPETITAAYLNGITPFSVTAGIPVTISPGDSAEITFQFTDLIKDTSYNDTLNFVFSPNCHPFSILVTGERGIAPPEIQAPLQSIVPLLLCTDISMDTIIIHNAGGMPLLLSSTDFSNSTQGFSVLSPVVFPIQVAPYDSTTLIIQFQPPYSPGSFNDTLRIYNNDTAPARNPYRINLTGSKDTIRYIGTLSLPLTHAFPRDTIVIPIILHPSVPLPSPVNLVISIFYNPTVLLPISSISGTIDSIKNGVLIFTSNGNNSDTIGEIKFIVGLGDSTYSPLIIDTIDWDNCPVSFTQNNGTVQVMGICTQGGTRLFDENGQLSLMQNAPNPFVSTTDIKFSIIEDGQTNITISDVLGHKTATLLNTFLPMGDYTVHFNGSSLNTGVYYYTLRTPSQVLRKTMFIEK